MTNQEPNHAVEGTILAAAKVESSATLRTNLSVHHLLAAAYFARQIGLLEKAHNPGEWGDFFSEILWLSSACVFSCVAGLEAYANELFVDRSQHFHDLRPEVLDKMWELLEQKPVLDKFDMARLLLDKPPADRGARPAQDIAALVLLRNGLTHFKPEWDNEQTVHTKIARQLQNRFSGTPFLPATESLFPRRWASYGCAKWAVLSCVNFLVDRTNELYSGHAILLDGSA
jgi:hypothetical protein